jgi:CO dehydrogenase maturation factor
MKIAISGKGGVGKTLIASLLCRVFAGAGYAVIAVDADPDANLAASLGLPHADKITPVSEMTELIEERTGTKIGESGPFFKLNPKVSDIPEKYAVKEDGISLMVMGRMKPGGAGCYCAENSFLQALMTHLLLSKDEIVIMDMAAGIEHLSRGTARMVDILLIVVEPGRQSIETAYRINGLAKDLRIKNVAIIGNKIRNASDKDFLTSSLPGFKFLGFVPYDPKITGADMAGKPLYEASPVVTGEVQKIQQELTEILNAGK